MATAVELPESEPEVARGKLLWAGPAAIAASLLAVGIVQRLALAWLQPLPKAYGLLGSSEPLVLTGVLVAFAVIVFAIVAHEAMRPVRTYRRIALSVLLISLVPDLVLGWSAAPGISMWPVAIVFAIMHVVAWLAAVETLVRLTRRPLQREPQP